MRRPRIILVLAIVGATATIASVTGALAFGSGKAEQPSTIPALAGGLEAQIDQAVAQGPYSITCDTTGDGVLDCSPIKDEAVIPALKRGEEVYGRTVIAFPNGGAKVDEDSGPTFDPTDLVCADGTGMTCSPVTVAPPTVRAGAQVFAFYRKHNVTFDHDGRPVSHLDAPTVPLRVLAAN